MTDKTRPTRGRSAASLADRFHARYEPVTETGCWIWSAGWRKPKQERSNEFYGKLYDKATGRSNGAHRVSWELHRGPIPDGMEVCHKCDTPACVNPDHLFLGSRKDNLRDMLKKGRHNVAKGERAGPSKLTADQVEAIKADGRLQREIAADYEVSPSTIADIKKGATWKGDAEIARCNSFSGAGHWTAKLDEEKVRHIRASTDSQSQLARQYGVTQSVIWLVKKRRTWKHVQ